MDRQSYSSRPTAPFQTSFTTDRTPAPAPLVEPERQLLARVYALLRAVAHRDAEGATPAAAVEDNGAVLGGSDGR